MGRSFNTTDKSWWAQAVFYQVYIRSFADASGDGIGDLAGITSRLPYLEELGIDAVWITPFYPSPMADGGYDVADPRNVEPLFGELDDFDLLVTEAHSRGIRVVIDLVPNHTSTEHPWFEEALASAPGSEARNRYHFLAGKGADGEIPPNNWPSEFGGPAWQRVDDGQWYMHIFAPEQADLNWDNPEVWDDLRATLGFWIDRGVDGFRIDVGHGMAKPPGLPDADLDEHGRMRAGVPDIRIDADDVHRIHALISAEVRTRPGIITIGEVWITDNDRLRNYIRPDELDFTFDFRLSAAEWDAAAFHTAIVDGLAVVEGTASSATWVLSNHDIPRHATRYGGGEDGLQRARAAALLQLALPGAPFIYQGDELGLPSVELPDEVLQDPRWFRSGFTDRGRDNCRVPIPWTRTPASYGFSDAADQRGWLPSPPGWAALSVESQAADRSSTLHMYREALDHRKRHPAIQGDVTALTVAGSLLQFRRAGGLQVLVNFADDPIDPGELDGPVLLASSPFDGGRFPGNTTLWVDGRGHVPTT